MPEPVLLILFLVFGIGVFLPMGALFARATKRSRGRLRRTGTIITIACALLVISSISLYSEGGMFEATSVLVGLNGAMVNYVSQSILLIMVGPIAAVNRQVDETVTLRLRQVMRVIRTFLGIPGIVMAGLSRTASFNYAVIAFMIATVMAVVVSTAAQFTYLSMLQNVIEKTVTAITPEGSVQSSQKMSDLLDRLSKSRKVLILYTCNIMISHSALVAIFFGLGNNFPYFWCIWPILLASFAAKFYQCYVLFQQSSAASPPSSTLKTASNDQKQVADSTQLAAAV